MSFMFDHLEMPLCSRQDIKIQLLTCDGMLRVPATKPFLCYQYNNYTEQSTLLHFCVLYVHRYIFIQLHWTIYSSALLHKFTSIYLSIQQLRSTVYSSALLHNISIKWTWKNHSVLNLVFTLTAKFSSILLPNFHNQYCSRLLVAWSKWRSCFTTDMLFFSCFF